MTMTDLIGDVSDEPVRIFRPPEHVSSNYSNLTNKYREKDVEYKKQYCKLYTVRLEKMLPLLTDRVKKKWGTKYPIFKLHKLQEEEQNKLCIIIGTLFKDQKLKPSLLKKISEANSLVPQPIYTHFTDDSDQLFIEDELQRYQIIGGLDIHKLVTGVTCAFLGTNQGLGKFSVEDYCFADCRPQVERPIMNEEKFVCFISGVDLVNYANIVMPLKLFIDWLVGFMGDESTQNMVRSVSRLIIAGNSVRSEAEVKKQTSLVAKVVESSETLNAVKQLDIVLNQFVRVLSVDLMPGQYDPSNHLLAQQPMHHCLFPASSNYKTLNCVTNPYECEIDGIKFLGTSGQPVTDICAYSRIEKSVDALGQCLVWNHIAPTAPDTLGSYPYYDKDPFVIEECPHVLFAGNQPEFDTKIHKGPNGQRVRLICLPQFSKTFSVVLLNLKNLECHEISFGVEDLE